MLAKYYRSKSHPQGESKEGIAYSAAYKHSVSAQEAIVCLPNTTVRKAIHKANRRKELLTLKEKKVLEKGLWQKTKKPGGVYVTLCHTL